jgi:hypothetical protein
MIITLGIVAAIALVMILIACLAVKTLRAPFAPKQVSSVTEIASGSNVVNGHKRGGLIAFWLYYLIPPIGIHLLFLLSQHVLNILTSVEEYFDSLGNAWLLTGAIIIPVYLLILSAKSLRKVNLRDFWVLLISMIAVYLLSCFVEIMSCAMLYNESFAVVLRFLFEGKAGVMNFQMIVAFIVIAVMWTIICIVKHYRHLND